ncbi:putative bifunctional diguanylate cyclase/phosphodiesterase [Ancylobacter lacus]|uniref:putative bifunctional diguanylate cyclase/phosphodiesterase n=1 Tax=Ancylobacter lacus TaxID=2579970 RepID=UPI001BCF5F64|nr:EAL domain-containing protein [Ancylobacter lacus]MBS7540867.1 EAL domain-containing protein [Ancylobacter lacus]
MPRNTGPADRMILAVALVILAAVSAMGAFSLVAAERIDASAGRRWTDLVGESLQRRASDLQRDLASFAHWDESVLRTAFFLDAPWVHRNFGKWLHDTRHHDRAYIVMGDRVTYAAIDGEMVAARTAPFAAAAIMPIVRGVESAYASEAAQAAAQESRSGEETRPNIAPVFRAGYATVDGVPALVGAISITPDLGRVVSPTRTPPIAVTVEFLDGDFLRDLIAELHLGDPAVSHERPGEDRLAVPIPFSDPAERPAWLSWLPEKAGATLLRALLPSLIGTAVLLLAASVIVLWFARRATADLAESEALASRLAFVDPLSGLANRAMFLRTLAARLPRTGGTSRLAVLFVDLDGFKDINDTLGHQFGDLLLSEVGSRLQHLASVDGLAARFGGDEFVLLLPIGPDKAELEQLCTNILEVLRQPFSIGAHTIVIGGSVGAVVAPDHSSSADELIRLADIAVYRAKAEGRATFRVFEPSMEAELRRRREVELELASALDRGEITAYFQPQMAIDGEMVIGCEALARWQHPRRGMIPPWEFISIAEQSGLITRLDMYVLRQACLAARDWGGIKLGVNLSAVDFLSHDLVRNIAAILEETGFEPSRLEVEITETLLVGNQPEAFTILSALREMNVRIALDDFGSGYSSLGYIRRFRIDSLKIDRSFIQNIGVTDDAPAIIDCVVRLARALGVTVTAEGVETRAQLRYLASVGCHHAQGYLFGTPMRREDFEQYLSQRLPRREYGEFRAASK